MQIRMAMELNIEGDRLLRSAPLRRIPSFGKIVDSDYEYAFHFSFQYCHCRSCASNDYAHASGSHQLFSHARLHDVQRVDRARHHYWSRFRVFCLWSLCVDSHIGFKDERALSLKSYVS